MGGRVQAKQEIPRGTDPFLAPEQREIDFRNLVTAAKDEQATEDEQPFQARVIP